MSESVQAIEHWNRNSIPTRTHALAFKAVFRTAARGARFGLTASEGCSRNRDARGRGEREREREREREGDRKREGKPPT